LKDFHFGGFSAANEFGTLDIWGNPTGNLEKEKGPESRLGSSGP
jgi:hypothetical protein